MLESIGMIATLKNVAADLTNRVLKLVQINEKKLSMETQQYKGHIQLHIYSSRKTDVRNSSDISQNYC